MSGTKTPYFPKGATISFTNVHFSYGKKDVLRGISLDIPAKGMTALVGPSGAGKTSIANLICRFWDPQQGQILINDIPAGH